MAALSSSQLVVTSKHSLGFHFITIQRRVVRLLAEVVREMSKRHGKDKGRIGENVTGMIILPLSPKYVPLSLYFFTY